MEQKEYSDAKAKILSLQNELQGLQNMDMQGVASLVLVYGKIAIEEEIERLLSDVAFYEREELFGSIYEKLEDFYTEKWDIQYGDIEKIFGFPRKEIEIAEKMLQQNLPQSAHLDTIAILALLLAKFFFEKKEEKKDGIS